MPSLMRTFALKAMDSSILTFSGVVLLTAFTASRLAFAGCRAVAVIAAVEALHKLILWGELFSCIM